MIDSRIEEALIDETSEAFFVEQLPTLRENVLESEKRINRLFVIILLAIVLSELFIRGVVTKLSVAGLEVEITKSPLMMSILPCIIAYYSYNLFNQLVLRKSLLTIYHKVIEHKYPLIAELQLDLFLTTHLYGSTEEIVTMGHQNTAKKWLNRFSSPFILVFQYLPFVYISVIFVELWKLNEVWLFIVSLLITGLFLLRSILMFLLSVQQLGGLVNFVRSFIQ